MVSPVGLEARLAGRFGLMIIRTDIETIVAAENPVPTPSQLSESVGLAAPKFNGEVRNASPGIHDVEVR